MRKLLDMERRLDDVPQWMKIGMLFIERVGFPTVAFLLIYYVCYVSISRMTDTLQGISTEIQLQRKELSTAIDRSWKDHQDIKEQIRELDIPRKR